MSVNCDFTDAKLRQICVSLRQVYDGNADKLDSIQTQIYIIAGVGGGIALVLILTLIILSVQLSRFRQRATKVTSKEKQTPKDGKKLSKSFDSQNGLRHSFPHQEQPHQHQSPPPHSYAQPPKPASAEDELAQMGFSAYTGHPVDQSRGFSAASPPMNNAGGVRVLPRNPPTSFRQNAGYNDGYM